MATAALGVANLIAQLVPVALNTYKQIQQANADSLPPVETILAAADADWDAVATTAQAQFDAVQGKPLPPTTGTPPT